MPDMPQLLDWAAKTLGVRVTTHTLASARQISGYMIDLSRFRLRLSELTPCLALDPALAAQPSAQIRLIIDDVRIENKWQQRNMLVLLDGYAADLRLLYRSDNRPPILLDRAAQTRVMSGGSQALIEEISRQTHITALAPYETSRPVSGEQFFGRDHELRTIVSNEATSYLIIGNRRMGKTSLMREVMRRARRSAKNPDAVSYFDCSIYLDKDDFFSDIVRRLAPREAERTLPNAPSMVSFLQRMARIRQERLLLCLDEIDALLEWDSRDGWTVQNTFRALTSMGEHEGDPPIRLLMAGFRLAHDLAKHREAPMFNFSQLISVRPFDLRATEELIVEPMLNLGVRFQDRSAVVHRIFRETGGQPNLIQHYCQYIVRHLEANDTRTLNVDVLDGAVKDDAIRRRTADELMINATNLEQLIIFLFLEHGWRNGAERFTLEDTDNWLKLHGGNLLRSDYEKALDALVHTGILNRDGRTFSFAFAALPHSLMESREPGFQIRKILEEGT